MRLFKKFVNVYYTHEQIYKWLSYANDLSSAEILSQWHFVGAMFPQNLNRVPQLILYCFHASGLRMLVTSELSTSKLVYKLCLRCAPNFQHSSAFHT